VHKKLNESRFGDTLPCLNRPPPNGKEVRRLPAWHLMPHGWSPRQITEVLGVSKGAVSQWMKRAREGGPEALHHRPPSGAPCRLSAEQLACRPALLHRGAEAYGFRGQVWTRGRIAAVIRLECGVTYPPSHVGRLLKALRWSLQKPARLAPGDLAGHQKGAQAHGQSLFFIDASGFYPLPSVVRTYAPVGPTPLLQEWWTRDHRSAMSAISPEGKRYVHCQDWASNSADVVALLEQLLREVPGRLVIMWDGAPIPRRHVIQECLANGAAQRIQIKRLPAYAPDLHPGEGLWAHRQGVELRHVCGFNLAHLRNELRDAVKRVRRKPRILKGCFEGAKL
jgi:transposase